ncbi:MAG: DUF1934 domain-containing protein [Ruminococcaceae bacterium]|nr:DUF1934 domain-containing protein [Oscillospiraceae bacterium]
MSKEVLITIHSTQNVDGDPAAAELITQGTYDYSAEAIRITYMESELTGLDGTKTMYHISPEQVILSRCGAVNSQMIFRRGEKQKFRYQTNFGTLSLGLDTHRLLCELDEHGGSMEIEYDIDFEHAFLSRNKFNINVREKELKS